LAIEDWPLMPYSKNARTIPEIAIERVEASLKEFGGRQPIIAVNLTPAQAKLSSLWIIAPARETLTRISRLNVHR
jgi:hypothetical protein